MRTRQRAAGDSQTNGRAAVVERLVWLSSVWVLAVGFGLVTLVRSHQIGIPLRDPRGTVFWHRLGESIALFAALVVVTSLVGRLRERRARGPVATRAAPGGRHWSWPRLAAALSGLLAYHVVYACYHNLKSWDAFNTQRDSVLLQVDRTLSFGHSPAVLLHDLLGQHFAAYPLAVVYQAFGYLVPFTFVPALVFCRRLRDGYVFLLASMWVWVLGVCSYYLVPALGPFAADPQEFSGLSHTIVTSTQSQYLQQRSFLLAHPAATGAMSKVGAFASLHVGFTTMVVLMLLWYRQRRAAYAVSLYLIAVIVSTIYFGWHYAADDLAGLLLAFLAVGAAVVTIYPHGRVESRSKDWPGPPPLTATAVNHPAAVRSGPGAGD